MMTGVNLVHVPYKGGAPAVADLVAGHVQVIFAPVSEAIPAHQGRQAARARGDAREASGRVSGRSIGGRIPAGL